MSPMKRASVLVDIDAEFPQSPMVLTLGGTAREMLRVVGRKPNHLVNLDAMGQTVSLGLGIALGLRARPQAEKTVVIEGDGSLIMGMSVMSTIGHLGPENLVVLVLDNGVYLATGGQPTASSSLDMCALALACGWRNARTVLKREELLAGLRWAAAEPGPTLLHVNVSTEQIATDFFLEDPVILARDFRDWLHDSEMPSEVKTS
jgi:thiamine pyrophosphate-dependent acetolactate synthase large subunit-like protein